MLKGSRKANNSWKTRTYNAPAQSGRAIRWKAAALRELRRVRNSGSCRPATLIIPPLFNFLPAENLAMGWFNEIDALAPIRQRMVSAAKITGWDVFTFHTLHNLDPFFDTTIAAIRETWLKEGNLSPALIAETKRRFGKPYDYFRIPARLVENLVFQSSLMDWIAHRTSDVPVRIHAIGTALLAALVSSASISFSSAVTSALKFGERWETTMNGVEHSATIEKAGWLQFERMKRLMEGSAVTSLAVPGEDLPSPEAPLKPFWYSPTIKADPMLITTSQEAKLALKTMNLASWAYSSPGSLRADESARGWLITPLHPIARVCRWSLPNYLLANPRSVGLFLDHVATLGRASIAVEDPGKTVQNRFRLSRIKVTGP